MTYTWDKIKPLVSIIAKDTYWVKILHQYIIQEHRPPLATNNPTDECIFLAIIEPHIKNIQKIIIKNIEYHLNYIG